MGDSSRSYRIRADVGRQNDSAIHVKLTQTYDTFDILSLEITQSNAYKLHQSDYGVVVGRIYANGGFGVPNARVSVFIKGDFEDSPEMQRLYGYMNTSSVDENGIRYNLLPSSTGDECHQDVGTFPTKSILLDNDDIIDVFDKYYRYTTKTNNSGDYMLFGVPKGSQTLHMDVDLSDIGLLSQKPRDMIYKGYNQNQFESPTKFKTDTNLSSLVQVMSQNAGIYVYPFWGDESDDGEDIAITRYDIELPYKFEPTCIFMGGIFTDTGSNSIGKNCTPRMHQGRMEELVAGEGSIEMIRKTYDGRIEEFQVKGNRVINGDGVWCYQIPMNLDYMTTDEFGNMVPTDNPDRGIPTRARVRFRISMDETPNDTQANKRCRYLVPNNPKENEDNPHFNSTKEVDYEFGSRTQEESFRDLFWNNVYTVKSYIPRIQKNFNSKDRRHTGIKMISHYGDNNPMPYNNLNINLGFVYRFLCILFKFFVQLIIIINRFLGIITTPICALAATFKWISDKLCFKIWKWRPLCFLGKPFKAVSDAFYSMVPSCVGLDKDFCGEFVTHRNTFYPGCDVGACIWDITKKKHEEKEKKDEVPPEERTTPTRGTDELYNCIETQLAEDNDVTSYNFFNDWINGSLYAPMWYRYIRKKRSMLFGLIKRRAKDQWCSSENYYEKLPRLLASCAVNRYGTEKYRSHDGSSKRGYYMTNKEGCACKEGNKEMCRCHDRAKATVLIHYGLVVEKETMIGQKVYYYKPAEYTDGQLKTLFATDIVLLGSLNDCDLNGVPQFYKFLLPTTYNMPENILSVDNTPTYEFDNKGNLVATYLNTGTSEASGADWGNSNFDLCGKNDKTKPFTTDGGLFFSIGCNSVRTLPKSCINLSRICELGVGADVQISVPELGKKDNAANTLTESIIPPDGFISFDELYGNEYRTIFASLNGNNLKTRINPETSFPIYDFRYLYVNGFDKSLHEEMYKRQTESKCSKINYKNNHELESFSGGYYDFRMGLQNYYYTVDQPDDNSARNSFPRYENSFYFYFGLKGGKTALDRFNSDFVADCTPPEEPAPQYTITGKPNSWCNDSWNGDGHIAFDLSKLEPPYTVHIHGTDNGLDLQFSGIKEPFAKFFFGTARNQEELTNMGYVNIRGHYGVTSPSTPTNLSAIPDYDSTEDLSITVSRENLYGDDIEDSDIVTLINGTYTITIQDGDGELYTTAYSHIPGKLDYDLIVSDFEDEENILIQGHPATETQSSRELIAEDSNSVDTSTSEDSRYIGGTICVVKPTDPDGNIIKNFCVEIWNEDDEVSDIVAYAEIHGTTVANGGKYLLKPTDSGRDYYDDKTLIFGVPKGGVNYNVSVRELCQQGESIYYLTDNVNEKTVTVGVARPMKLYIGDVDYEIIKDWKVGQDDDIPVTTDIFPISNNGVVSKDWVKLSSANYKWEASEEITEAIDYINTLLHDESFADLNISFFKEIAKKYPNPYKYDGNSYTYTILVDRLKTKKETIDEQILSNQEEIDLYTAAIEALKSSRYDTEATCGVIKGGYKRLCDFIGNEKHFDLIADSGYVFRKCVSEQLSDVERAENSCDDETFYYLFKKTVVDGDVSYEKAVMEELIEVLEEGQPDPVSVQNIYEDAINRITELKAMQDEVIDAAKRTFRINCESGEKSINIQLDTANRGSKILNGDVEPTLYPQYHTGYNEEISSETNNWNTINTFTKKNGDSATIDGITIPTITYKGSEVYDDTSKQSYDSTPAYRHVYNLRQGVNKRKYPYFVYAENKREKTLPEDKKYFGFHITDKTFRARFNTWSATIGFPMVDDDVDTEIPDYFGKYVNIPGMFAGYAINGYPTPETIGDDHKIKPSSDGYDTQFVEQTIDPYVLKMETLYNDTESDEDDMCLFRFVTGGEYNSESSGLDLGELTPLIPDNLIGDVVNGLKWCDGPYDVTSKVGGEKTKAITPIPLLPTDNQLYIKDSFDCQLSYDLRPTLSITLDPESRAERERANCKLIVTIDDFTEDDKVYYKFVAFDEKTEYPLHKSNLESVSIGTPPINDIQYLKIVSDDLKYKETKFPASTIKNSTVINNKNYAYVIAEYFDGNRTESGRVNRVISPLYDFRSIYAVFFITSETYMGENEDGEIEEKGRYVLNAEFRNGSIEHISNVDPHVKLLEKYGSAIEQAKRIPYYLLYYPFEYDFQLDLWGISYTASGRLSHSKNGENLQIPYARIPITEETYYELGKYSHRMRESLDGDNTEMIVTDITGLQHDVKGIDWLLGRTGDGYRYGKKKKHRKIAISMGYMIEFFDEEGNGLLDGQPTTESHVIRVVSDNGNIYFEIDRNPIKRKTEDGVEAGNYFMPQLTQTDLYKCVLHNSEGQVDLVVGSSEGYEVKRGTYSINSATLIEVVLINEPEEG